MTVAHSVRESERSLPMTTMSTNTTATPARNQRACSTTHVPEDVMGPGGIEVATRSASALTEERNSTAQRAPHRYRLTTRMMTPSSTDTTAPL